MTSVETIANGIGGGDAPVAKAPVAKGNKNLSVEKIYQKKTQLEHILLRPDTYIGSVEPVTEEMWVYDDTEDTMVQRQITYVPGLYKIYDEILVNAADNKQRDEKMDCIRIVIDPEKNVLSVWNNGKGIPVVMHKDEKMMVPTMIFGHLLTSSNYNDEEEKVTGGRNGYGAKLCNIFSTKFTVETACKEYKKEFKQVWANNMSKASEPKVKEFHGEDFTKITFSPDLSKFGMETLDKDTVQLLSRRAYDVAASTRGVKVYLNGKRLPVKSFKDYIELYIKKKEDELGNPLKIVYENVNTRWEVAMTISDKGFQQVSFVNSIATTKGGRHVDHVADMIVKQVSEQLKKKNKGGITVKAHQVKNHLWLFINSLIVNPTFDSQTKENMTLQAKSFGSKCNLSEKFVTGILKSGIVESVLTWAKFKQDNQLKAQSGKKKNKLKGIPKLEDANNAGSRNSLDCTLILTEGDSAKTLAVSGLGVVGRDNYGVFPLRGKLLNVREATHKQILDNAEITNLIKILGLVYKKKYESIEDLKTLRYGKLMIMTDQDQDGSHIKGLLINFIHHNWPTLLKLPFLEEFITPIVKATKNKEELSFYSLPEFEEWKANKNNWHTYKIKYYKGLGTSTSKEAKEYFADMKRHRILFEYGGPNDDSNINMAFSKKCAEQRKEWLTNWMEEMKRRRELGLPEQYLYEKDTKSVNYSDFVNKELVLFSNLDNERSIPCMIDGLKPGQRKVLYTCFKRKDKREVKVAQLAGSVAEHSAYHHGEQSLMSTIINLAQNFVGSNNINLLQPIGQFGSRLTGGKDAASPRYIFTMLSPLARNIFNELDEPLLNYQFEDNQKIEPVWFIPIIPMVLVNGADGIGTGWMTKIPNYNPREIAQNILKLLDGQEPSNMIPWYKNFRGTIEALGNTRYVVYGEVAIINEEVVEISELPIGTWTQAYKENVLESMLSGGTDSGSNKTPPAILDFRENNTDTTVRFEVFMTPEKLAKAEEEGLHKFFKLQTTISGTSMCAFDENGCMRRYDNVVQILKDFYKVRLEYYEKRKGYLEGMLQAESKKLSNQARFILEKCNNTLVVENKKKKVMIEELQKRGYDPDPVRQWKLRQNKEATLADEAEDDANVSQDEEDDCKNPYDYLLGMAMWSLTQERKEELLKKRDEKLQEYKTLQAKTPSGLWKEDLEAFLEKLDAVETQEKIDAEITGPKGMKLGGGKKLGGAGGRVKKVLATETKPSPMGRRIEPKCNPELLKKFEKADINKEKVKRPRKKKDNINGEDEDEIDQMGDGETKSLKDRLGKSPQGIEKKQAAKRKVLKQTKLSFKGKDSPKKGKGRKRRDSDSYDSDSNSSDSEFSPTHVRAENVAPQRTTARRSAAAKVKFNYDESEEESDGEPELYDNNMENGDEGPLIDQALNDESVVISDTDSEFESKPAARKNNKAAPAPQIRGSSDSMFDSLVEDGKRNTDKDDDFLTSSEPESKKKATSKKKVASAPAKEGKPKNAPKRTAPKKIMSDSEDDIFESKSKKKKGSDDDFDISAYKAPPRSGGRSRKVVKYTDGDDDSD